MRRDTPTGGTNHATGDENRANAEDGNAVRDERSGTTGLSPWDRAELLSSRRRRAILSALVDRRAPVTLEHLAADVARREDARTGVTPREDARTGVAGPGSEETERRVAVALHHVHLPKLADGDVVDYDPELNLVESFDPEAVAP